MKKTFFDLRKTALFLPLSLAFMAVCCKDPEPPKPVDDTPTVTVYPDSLAGELKVQFMHDVDGQPLVFAAQQYVNPAGDSFKVVDLKYYISNLKLKNTTTGKTFAVNDSYYLIRPTENKTSLDLKGIPVKEYNQVEFSIGVDPVANATSAHTNDLDPANGMAWDWDTGYKFFVFTGNRISRIPAKNNNSLVFHIGENKNYRTFTFPLNQTLSFQKDKPYSLQVGLNLNELFKSPNLIDFDVVTNVMDHSPNADKMANNYAEGMFRIIQVAQ